MIKTKNHEFERIILKGLLSDKNLCKKLLTANFSDEIFDVPVHKFIYRCSKERYNKSTDLITDLDLKYLIEVDTKDEKNKELKLAVLDEAIKEIDNLESQPTRYNFCWEELVRLFQKRKFLDICEDSIGTLKSTPNLDPVQLFSRFEKEIHNVKKSSNHVYVDKENIFSKESVDKRIQQYDNDKGKGTNRGLPYFLPRLTEVTGGIKPTDLVLFIARQKVGKSITLLNQAVFLTSLGYNVAYVSIEQSKEEITLRADSLASELKHVDLKMKTLDPHNETLYKARLTSVASKHGQFHCIDIPRGCTLNLIEKEVKDLTDQGILINAVVIDYLGLLNSEGDAEKFYFNIGVITKQLKEFCREHKIPVITAHQMTRESEKSATKTGAGIAYSDQISSHVDICFALVKKEENLLEIQTVLARDCPAITIQCISAFERMLIFERKLENSELDDSDPELFD